MAAYELYGFMSNDINGARNLLEASLGIRFDAHESDYQGGEYFQCGNTCGEHFVLKRNIDPVDGEPSEMSFPIYQILFYVNDAPLSIDLLERINQNAKYFVLLRHENFD